jgi:hypothetical protein
VIHKEGAATLGFFGDRFLGLALRAHKQYVLTLRGKFAHEAAGFAEHFEGFLQVDNVDAVAFPENVFLHFRVPASRLVTEVNAGLQQFFHRNFYRQVSSLLNGCFPLRCCKSGFMPPLPRGASQQPFLPVPYRP